jgi:hypothetical protein
LVQGGSGINVELSQKYLSKKGLQMAQVAKRLPGKHKTSTNQPTNKQINVQRSIKIDKNMPGRVFLAEKM